MIITRASIFILTACFVVNVWTRDTSVKHERAMRVRRQNPGDAFIDAIFQIPIQTLSAVGTVVKTSRPVIMNVRQRIQQSLTSLTPSSAQRPQRQTSAFAFASASQRRRQRGQHRLEEIQPQPRR